MKITTAFIIFILPFNVLAAVDTPKKNDVYWYNFDWNIDGVAKTEYINIKTETRGRYKALIQLDKAQNQRLYFMYGKLKTSTCDTDDDVPKLLKIDGQVINVKSWCIKYSDSKNKYMQFTPSTTKAVNFVINKFKLLPEVKVDFGEYGNVFISAKGFQREWNSHNNAL